jgi:hypothetical protein
MVSISIEETSTYPNGQVCPSGLKSADAGVAGLPITGTVSSRSFQQQLG